MKAKYTEGPWTVEVDAYNPKGYVVIRDTTEKVEQAGVGHAMAICQAWRIKDAALIAAAPELLAALEQMRDDWLTAFDNDIQEGNEDAVKILADADAAIAKARGANP